MRPSGVPGSLAMSKYTSLRGVKLLRYWWGHNLFMKCRQTKILLKPNGFEEIETLVGKLQHKQIWLMHQTIQEVTNRSFNNSHSTLIKNGICPEPNMRPSAGCLAMSKQTSLRGGEFLRYWWGHNPSVERIQMKTLLKANGFEEIETLVGKRQ